MLLSILFFVLSIVPSVLIFIWLRNRQKDHILYRKKCTYSFVSGLISVLPIILLSAILYIYPDPGIERCIAEGYQCTCVSGNL